jgi:hypothetical protein
MFVSYTIKADVGILATWGIPVGSQTTIFVHFYWHKLVRNFRASG